MPRETGLCDVAVIGGGPAGCATALALRQHDPTLNAVLIEGSDYRAARVGEVLPGVARRMLEHLGVWDATRDRCCIPAAAMAIAWGSDRLMENHSISTTDGHGWHLERNVFDSLLADECARRSVDVIRGIRVTCADRHADRWLLRLADGSELRVRFLVDATGRHSTFARKLGSPPDVIDRLVAYTSYNIRSEDQTPAQLLESTVDGWWYSAVLPGSLRVTAFLTDSDIGHARGLHRCERWKDQLQQTRWIRRVVCRASMPTKVLTVSANSVCLDPACGDDWIAVGDSASAFDPLSGQGILKALRSGIFAAYAVSDQLTRRDPNGLERYRTFIRQEFAGYREKHHAYCATEPRWPDAPFWARRNGASPS